MNKSIEKYIQAGMVELKAYSDAGNPLKKTYKGYLSSFGASVIMSGLIPTLAFYANADEKSERKVVLDRMFNILKNNPNYSTITEDGLFNYALNLNNDDKGKLEKELLNVSVALKLCIRTFPLI